MTPRHLAECWYEVESGWHCVPGCAVERCHCGRPLHYGDPYAERAARALIADLGPCVVVETPEGRWSVPRHYIALHGLKAPEVPTLGFERAP